MGNERTIGSAAAPTSLAAGDPPDPAELVECARTMAHVSRGLERALAEVDLTLPQYRLLSLLGEGESAGGVLAGRLAVTPPSITAVVDGLVERGLVERRHDSSDRRRIAHALTPAGVSALADGDRATSTQLASVASFIPPDQRRLALTALAAWERALKDEFQHRIGRTHR